MRQQFTAICSCFTINVVKEVTVNQDLTKVTLFQGANESCELISNLDIVSFLLALKLNAKVDNIFVLKA